MKMEVAYSGEIIPYGRSVVYGEDMLYLQLDGIWRLYRYRCGCLERLYTTDPFVYHNIITNLTYLVTGECIERFDGCGLYLDYSSRAIYRVSCDKWYRLMDIEGDGRVILKAITEQTDPDGQLVDWEEVYDISDILRPEGGVTVVERDGVYSISVTVDQTDITTFPVVPDVSSIPRLLLLRNGDIVGSALLSATATGEYYTVQSTSEVSIVSDYLLEQGDRLTIKYEDTYTPGTFTISDTDTDITGDYANLIITGSTTADVTFNADVAGDVIVRDASMGGFVVNGSIGGRLILEGSKFNASGNGVSGVEVNIDVELVLMDNNDIDSAGDNGIYSAGDGTVNICGDHNSVQGDDVGILIVGEGTVNICGDHNDIVGYDGIHFTGEGNMYICGDRNYIHSDVGGSGIYFSGSGIYFDSGAAYISGNYNEILGTFISLRFDNDGDVYVDGDHNNIHARHACILVADIANIYISGIYNTISADTDYSGIQIRTGRVSICGDYNAIYGVGGIITARYYIPGPDSGPGTVEICGNHNDIEGGLYGIQFTDDGTVVVCGRGNAVEGDDDNYYDVSIDGTGVVQVVPGNTLDTYNKGDNNIQRPDMCPIDCDCESDTYDCDCTCDCDCSPPTQSFRVVYTLHRVQ